MTVQRDGANSLVEPNLKKSQSQGGAGVDTINDPKHVSYTLINKLPRLGMGKVVTQTVVGAKTLAIALCIETFTKNGDHAQLLVLQTRPITLSSSLHS